MEPEDSSEILNGYATYLADVRGMTPSTAKAYTAAARELARLIHARPAALLLPDQSGWEAIDKRALEIHLNHLRDARGWRAATLAAHLRALRSFFGWLLAAGQVERDPTRGLRIESPRHERALPEGGEDAVRALFLTPRPGLAGARAILLIELIYGGGLKPIQAYSVRGLETDRGRGIARLTSEQGALEIPLSPEGLSRAEAYLTARAETLRSKAALEEPNPESGAGVEAGASFWIASSGRAVGPAALARQVRLTMERAGLSGGAAALRQLAALHFRARGADVRSLQRFLGARRLSSLGRYDANAEGGDVQALRRMAEQLKKSHPRHEPG